VSAVVGAGLVAREDPVDAFGRGRAAQPEVEGADLVPVRVPTVAEEEAPSIPDLHGDLTGAIDDRGDLRANLEAVRAGPVGGLDAVVEVEEREGVRVDPRTVRRFAPVRAAVLPRRAEGVVPRLEADLALARGLRAGRRRDAGVLAARGGGAGLRVLRRAGRAHAARAVALGRERIVAVGADQVAAPPREVDRDADGTVDLDVHAPFLEQPPGRGDAADHDAVLPVGDGRVEDTDAARQVALEVHDDRRGVVQRELDPRELPREEVAHQIDAQRVGVTRPTRAEEQHGAPSHVASIAPLWQPLAMRLDDFDPGPFRARREKLAAALDADLVIAAGAAPARNYPGNPYPFRASSHFLYLVGASLEGGRLVRRDGAWILELPEPPPDDALWHGVTPGFTELSERLGVPVVALRRAPADALATPVQDLATRLRLESELGRPLGEADAPLLDAIVALRLVHDAHAIAGLREAAEATVAAHLAGMAATRPGATEAEVCAAMEGTLAARGMGTAYGSIVTVHGEVLHQRAHDGTCAEGDLLLADLGAETAGGWAGDVTRTWPVSGRFSTTQRELYEVVLESQRAALEAAVPGARYRDVHLRAATVLTEGLVALGILKGAPASLVERGAHALFFPHGVGHLLGLDVHDMEDLGDRAGYAPGRKRSEQFGLAYLRLDRDLEPGMAVTIEPGFYRVPAILEDPRLRALAGDALDEVALARFDDVRGIRIEDDVLITADGGEVLTAALPKSLAAIEAAFA